MKLFYEVYNSPIGNIYVVCNDKAICKVELYEDGFESYVEKNVNNLSKNEGTNAPCSKAILQLQEYFSGERKDFELPLEYEGTEFQKKAWQALLEIPYGETRSYKQQAEAIGNPKAVRAIGQANRVNRIPIIIPCHRVIGQNGSLVGYAGARIGTKKYLLELEKRI